MLRNIGILTKLNWAISHKTANFKIRAMKIHNCTLLPRRWSQKFLQNCEKYLSDWTASYPRRQKSCHRSENVISLSSNRKKELAVSSGTLVNIYRLHCITSQKTVTFCHHRENHRPHSSTLKTEPTNFWKMLLHNYQAIRYHTSEDSNPHKHSSDNFKSHCRALNMEAAIISETSVNILQTVFREMPKHDNPQNCWVFRLFHRPAF